MNSNIAPLFLDTSIQIERLIGPNPRRVAIERQLAAPEPRAITSRYVLMEFQRSVWSDYVRVYNHVLQHERWEAVAQALRSGVLAYRPRSLGRCLQILAQAMVVSRLEREHGLDLLETQITRDLSRRFWRHTIPLPDSIACDLLQSGIARQPDGVYTVADTCRKAKATCRLPSFLAERQPQLRAITEHLAAHPNVIKDQPRVERLLTAVLADSRAALGQAACWPLGFVESSAERRRHHRLTNSPRRAPLDTRQAGFCRAVGPPRFGTLHISSPVPTRIAQTCHFLLLRCVWCSNILGIPFALARLLCYNHLQSTNSPRLERVY